MTSEPFQYAPEITDLSARAQWAARAIRENIAEIQNETDLLGAANLSKLAPIQSSFYDADGPEQDQKFKVGIIGAGVAGLFTGMIFDHLKSEYGLDVEYEILEANGEDRIGGRLYTHHFSDNIRDYYDVGAMRFPDIDIMQRTFQLFETLHMKRADDKSPYEAEIGELIKYYFEGDNCRELYNDIGVNITATKTRTAETFKITNIPEEYKGKEPGKIIEEAIYDFTQAYKKDGPRAFWDLVLEKADPYSVRQYLSTQTEKKLDYNTIEWLETMNYGNRWYDQAFSEMVLESLDFDHKKPWVCVMGGSQEIARRMAKKPRADGTLHLNKVVTAIGYEDTDQNPDTHDPVTEKTKVEVTLRDGEMRSYDAVFNSAPLGAMQHMYLKGLNLNWGTKQAIRSLGYGASCKVGVRFKSKWWLDEPYLITKGGVSKTDLPIRCCVYPSYNIKDAKQPKTAEEEGGVLLVSYTWSAEADKIGSLINRNSPDREDALKELLLQNLARLHTTNHTDETALYKRLHAEYETHFAYNWYSDPTTVGAFAYFGPGQFQNMYQYIVRNNGKHIIIGEAASAHHAWVVGALESAVRGVYQFLFKHSKLSKSAHEALTAYNENRVPGPYGPLPAEFDRTKDVEMLYDTKSAETVDQPTPNYSAIGEFARLGVWGESVRISKQEGDLIDSSKLTEFDLGPIFKAIHSLQPEAA